MFSLDVATYHEISSLFLYELCCCDMVISVLILWPVLVMSKSLYRRWVNSQLKLGRVNLIIDLKCRIEQFNVNSKLWPYFTWTNKVSVHICAVINMFIVYNSVIIIHVSFVGRVIKKLLRFTVLGKVFLEWIQLCYIR